MANLKNTIINDTGHLTLPAGTTVQRPGSPTQGMSRFNTTTKVIEYYDGTAWISVGLLDGGGPGSAATSVTALRDLVGATAGNDKVYWFNTGGATYQAYAVMNSAFDGGGWLLSFNIDLQAATSHLGGLPQYENTTFWTGSTVTNDNIATPWASNVKTRGFDTLTWTDMMVMVHNKSGFGTTSATTRGWAVYRNTLYTGNTMKAIFENGGRTRVLTSGGRRAVGNYVGNLTWNSSRPQTRGGDAFIDSTVNGFNNGSDNLVFNAQSWWGSNQFGDYRITTTAGQSNPSYGYTGGGCFGGKHGNNQYASFIGYSAISAYCDGREWYGASSNYQTIPGYPANYVNCMGTNIPTVGAAVFVR
jgi:hypothetical protein